jgi:hypothetical protein
MKQPLIMRAGLLQSSGDEKLSLPRVNFGPSVPIYVTDNSIDVFATMHHLIPDGENQVDTINGGEEGDVLILTGEGVIVRQMDGPHRWVFRLDDSNVLTLIFIHGSWFIW